MNRRELAALTLLSGSAGLSYEVLYARLASQYFGEVFYVQAGVLCTMVFGIAVGAFASDRLRGRLPQLEIGLGLFALVAAAVHATLFSTLVGTVVPAGAGPFIPVTLTAAVLLPAAIAMGASIPLFAIAWADDDAYPTTYGLYNLGAAAAVLLVEYAVVRSLGLTGTLVAFGLVDIAVGLRLRRLQRDPVAPPRPSRPAPQLALVVAGMLSGLYQLHALKQMQIFWGPFRETFALHVFGAIASIGIVSLVLARRRVGLRTWLTVMAVGLPLTFVMPSVVMPLYPTAAQGLEGLPRHAVATAFIAALYLPPLMLLGGLLPSLYNTIPDAGPKPLGMNALGNAIGFAAYPLLVHPIASDRSILLGVGAGFVVTAALVSRRASPVLGVLGLVALGWRFDARLHTVCFRDLYSPAAYQRAIGGNDRRQTIVEGPGTLVYRQREGGTRSATVNGHRTVWVHPDAGNLAELLHGIAPLPYVARREHALSIGMGTGISTGALAETFDRVTAIEISAAIVRALPHFEAFNFDVAARSDVQVRVADGLTFLYRSDELYDLILLTVDGPFYQSSSKLYSRELYRRARQRLTDDGVLAFWIEQSYALEITETIIATVRTEFEHCALSALNAGYLQMLCGNAPLHFTALTDADLTPALRVALARRFEPSDFLRRAPSLFFDRVALLDEPPRRSINTLDRPVLEFAKTTHQRGSSSLVARLGVDFDSQPDHDEPLSPMERRLRCGDLTFLVGDMLACAPGP